MTSRAACARRLRTALPSILALSEKPHGQRLCGRCTDTRAARVELCGGTLRHARDAITGARPACFTHSARYTRATPCSMFDDTGVDHCATPSPSARESDACTQRFASTQHRKGIAKASQGHRGGIEALRSGQGATTAKHRGNTPSIAAMRSRRAARCGARAPRIADAFAPSRRTRRGGARWVVRPLRGLLQQPCAGTFCCATITRKRPLHAAWREPGKRRGAARAGPRRIAARRLPQ
ncbi:hypothetical protein C7416_104116 [Cupriavidus phytorum]|uniref:Uncharacterized protein n=1 Tax=Cupriavidus phytorum TaxID=3024399 RepID=A0A2W7P0N7_9BURK|nr:hypothetical protein C7416_104116 [Cupriavidus alkaliphilus]